MHKDHYDDAHMLCKVLDSMAAMAIDLKCKIEEGHQLPSWAEYKVYKAGDSIKSALSSTYSMKGDMPATIAIQKIASGRHVVMDNTKERLLGLVGRKGKTGKLKQELENVVGKRNMKLEGPIPANAPPQEVAARTNLAMREMEIGYGRRPGYTRARIKQKMFKRE